ncbi:MAG: alpha/beta fold hydrolase [Victivallales bacterium]|nr:alpha/beta fold hydrolase [Victivallales bacterium]
MKRLVFPKDWIVEEWHGFKRYKFKFQGYDAWIAEPHVTAGDGRWSWCMVWPEAFVRRVGIESLLEHGFYHVHIDTFATRANKEGIRVMGEFQDMLVGIGLSPKVNLIGMSWGGFFSLRYAEENPGRIAAIYLDAPVCNAADPDTNPEHLERRKSIENAYGLSFEELKTSKMNPLNNVEAIVNAKIPLMAALGQTDMSVCIENNYDLFEKRLLELGGSIKAIRRNYWGHHPHGLDDPTPILEFHCAAREC